MVFFFFLNLLHVCVYVVCVCCVCRRVCMYVCFCSFVLIESILMASQDEYHAAEYRQSLRKAGII